MPSRIEELWRQHEKAPFPAGCRGEEVAAIDLVLIDAETAGCVSTFLGQAGRLDPWRLAILGLCYRNLAVVAAVLEGEDREYFTRLEELAGMVLCALRDKSKRT
jgi:hypothetical protein